MGAGNSSMSDLASNVLLKRLVGPDLIDTNDEYWTELLSFSFSVPNTSSDYRLLEESVFPLINDLMKHNSSSGNLSALVQVLLTKVMEVKSSKEECENKVLLWQLHNSLVMLRVIVKIILQSLPEDEVIAEIHRSPVNCDKGITDEDNCNLMENLLSCLVEIIVDVPLSDYTYNVHVEATACLIVLTSAVIFGVREVAGLAVFRLLMLGRPSIHACLLVKTLLRRFMAQDRPPVSSVEGSIVLGLAASFWSALTLGMTSPSSNPEVTGSPLAGQSVLLLLILTNHCTAREVHNPFRQAMLNAQNFQDPANSTPTQAVAIFKLEFSSLYNTLCQHLQEEQTTLVLYLLLHKNTDFRTYILARTDIENLVLPILHTLYEAPQSTSHHVYMSLIVLLILSEDDSFNKSVHDVMVKSIPWYTERIITDVSLGGLLILVVIRTITYNMSKMRDRYLHTNCLAALANMSCQFRQLHPYVCQRLVALFETLAKRHQRLTEELRHCQVLVNDNDITDALTDVGVLEEVIRMVLEILNSVLTHQLQHNTNLVYTLMYKRHMFVPYTVHVNFQDVTSNIDVVLSYLMARLETTKRDPGVSDVQEVIQQGVLHLPKDRLKKFPELKFKYVEENEPEDFFVPYVWTLVYQKSGIYWDPRKVQMFDPVGLDS